MGKQTRRLSKVTVSEFQFADDVAVVGLTREEIERAAHTLDEVVSEWGLTANLSKTKLIVVNGAFYSDVLQPISIRGEFIEVFSETHHTRVFGVLCRPVFHDGTLSLKTKRMAYHSVVLGVLLYGLEAWVNKRTPTKKLVSFSNKCFRWILKATRSQQHARHITRKMFGVEKTLQGVVTAKRLW